jgi:hypothetical protein|tara:strand:- start:3959 stop:4351 length:393 start_codon:yes stop_codon:yes gene_type:complete
VFSREELAGIFLSIPTAEVSVVKANNMATGYRVRLRICIRGKLAYLKAIQRSLLQCEIECVIKEKENKQRPKPILIISDKKSMERVLSLVPHKPSNVNWHVFDEIFVLYMWQRHLTQEGLDEILELKGVL